MLYFAYGANMSTSVMTVRCPVHRVLGGAQLRDHRLAFTRRSLRWGGGVADIVPAPGETVWGALYEIAAEGLSSLDRAEGVGFAYRRRLVEVVLGEERYAATAYEVADKELDEIEPRPEYRALMTAGAREHGLPVDLGSWGRFPASDPGR